MNNHLLSQFFNVDEEQLLAAAESFAAAGPQIWPASNPVYVKTEDSGDDASSNASWGFPATSTTPMDYDDAPATINCIPGGLAQISLPGSSRSPSPDMTLTLPGGFNFAAASQQQKPVSALPAHLRPREMALNPSSLVSPSVVPTPLQQQQQQQQQQSSPTQASKSNGRKLNSTSSAPSPAPSLDIELSGQPHPYSISPSNTTALFTRASSVSSNTSGPTKKGRAPPSGPISTKDFVPPDVSGLSKREARLVKNRAAAFLSRQRKREEFEGLEARVEVLEADNARLYKELEAYRSGGSSSAATAAAAAPAIAPAGATPAALQAELVGLRRQLGARDQELAKLHGRMQALNAEANAERERAAQKDAEIAQLKRQIASRGVATAAAEDSDSDSEDAQSDGTAVSGKKDLKSAGSMAFMVLLFSLSSLLTSAESSGSAKPPVASERVRRPGMHHRDSSRTYLDLPQQAFSSGLAYDTFLSTSDSSMMLSPSFGFDEDNLLGGSSAFAGLTSASTASPSRQPQQQQQQQPKTQDNHVADSLASAISGVKSISPEEFEFDFTVPSTSSSSLDCFTFPARPQQQQAGKKIRVCVKSALPLNLNLDALSKAASTSVAAASQKAKENDVFTSSFGYRVPETDDLLGDSGFWSAAASTFGGSSSPSSVLSPTMSTASSESRKRKRVVVEINPRGGSRRRLSEETNDGDDEMDTWDVKFSEDDDLVIGGGGSFDEDVQMRL